MSNQQINCNVRSCRHNNQGHACTLSSINVGSTATTPHRSADTECDSFEE